MRYVFIVSLLYAAHAMGSESETVFNQVRDSVVTITVYDERKLPESAGSGVVIAPQKVVTNCHVVNEAVSIRVRANDKDWDAAITVGDDARDLCELSVPGLKAPPVKIRPYREIEIGEAAYAIGNPLGFGLAVSAGLISSKSVDKNEPTLFSSAPISPGSSGGGLFDNKGRLMGITTGGYRGAQNLNLALPAEWIGDLAQRGKQKIAVPPSLPDPNWIGQAETFRSAAEWTKLESWARQWLVAYPTSALAGSYLALSLLTQGRPQEAKQVSLASLQHDPRLATSHAYLAHARYTLGEKEAAYIDLDKAIELSPTTSYFFITHAYWRRADGDIVGSLAAVRTALKFAPNDENCWQLLGELLYTQRQLAEAAQAFRTVLRLKPNFPNATTGLALALAGMGEATNARQLLTSRPTGTIADAGAWLNIGVGEDKQNHFAEAERAYRKAVELKPDFGEAWYALGHYLWRMNRDPDAEEALRLAVKYKPGDAKAWLMLAETTKRRGNLISAKEAFERASTLDPTMPGAWFGLGVIKRELNEFAGAIVALEKTVRLDASKAEAWAFLGELQLRGGLPDAAIKSLQEAEKRDPKNEYMLQALSMYYGTRGDPIKALEYAERALQSNTASPQNWNNKGYTLLKLKRYPEAIPTFETAIRLQPDFHTAWINLGEAQLLSKQVAKAITALEQALKLRPAAEDARFFLAQAYMAAFQPTKAKENLTILLNQRPKHAPAWALMTLANLAEKNQAEANNSFKTLKVINPAMASNLRKWHIQQYPLSSFTLPE